MKSAAKSHHKWDRKTERQKEREKETETKADFCSGHKWVGFGLWRDTSLLKKSVSSEQAASISQRSSNQHEQLDEMSGCQNID